MFCYRQHSTVEIKHYVVKTSTGPDKVESTTRLSNTYHLAEKIVPHVDSILHTRIPLNLSFSASS